MVKEYIIPCTPKEILNGKDLKIAQLEWKIKFHQARIEEAKKQIKKLKEADNYDKS